MKLTAFILLTACLTASASGGYSQITLVEKNVPLQKVFKKIQEQSGYFVLYPAELVRKAGTVTVDVRNVSLEQALKAVLNGKQLSFVIRDRTVMIKESEKQLAEQQELISPPTTNIRGRVLNDKGEPVKGVTVAVKGTDKATSTDNNGGFILNDVDADAVLVFTGVNTETLELPVRGRTQLFVSLKTKITALDEMQVIAYGTTSRRLQTGAVSSVTAETIEKQPVGDVLLALKGQVPGLNITQGTAVPGARVEFNIRGLNSLNALANAQGSNDPLIIVDGVPLSTDYVSPRPLNGINQYSENGGLSPLASINPADIERVDVLKDADATAIYGSRGANGVILITTKKAKPGKPTLNVDLSQGIGRVARKLDMLNIREYLDMRYEAFANDGVDWRAPNAIVTHDLSIWDTTRYTDWQKELAGGTAKYTRAQVSYAGGNTQNSISLAGNYWKEGSIFGDQFGSQTFSGRVGFNHRSPGDRFRIDMSAFFSKVKNVQPNSNPYANALSLPPNAPKLYNDDGSLNWENNTFRNPMSNLLITQEITSHRINASALLSYRLFKNGWLKADVGYGKGDIDMLTIQPNAAYNPALATPTLNRKSQYSRQANFSTNLEPYAQYDGRLGPGKLNALAGLTLQTQSSELHYIEANDFLSDDMIRNYGTAGSLRASPVQMSEYRYVGVYARLNYNIHNKYLVTLNARRDGSSRFGPGKQFGNFGSAALAWIFSEEAAVKKAMPFVSFGKLRLSYGTTGSDNIGNYQYLSLYAVRVLPSTLFQPPYTVLNPVSLFNPNYAWESNRKADVELSLGFFKDRIVATANYYRNRSSNQLVGQQLPPSTGFATVTENMHATVQNTGWELQLNTENVKSKNFSWNSNFNFTIPRNKLIEYPDLETSPNARLFVVGQPVSLRRVWNHAGVDPRTGVNVYRTADGKDTSFTRSGTLPLSDRINIDMTPKFYGGFTNNFRYKNWGLSIMLTYSERIKVNDIALLSTVPGFMGNITRYVYNNSWRKPGDEVMFQKFTQSSRSPAYYSVTGSGTEQYYSNIWWVRLNTLSLSYSLPHTLLQKLHLASCQFYVNGQSLYTLTNFRGSDPETGVDAMPPLRIITAGVQLKF